MLKCLFVRLTGGDEGNLSAFDHHNIYICIYIYVCACQLNALDAFKLKFDTVAFYINCFDTDVCNYCFPFFVIVRLKKVMRFSL